MILERGDMFSVWGKTDLFLFTSNPIVNKQGLAVMGRGIAKQLADKVPEIRKVFASFLEDINDDFRCYCDYMGYYGDEQQRVGFFMVKSHWREPADLEIIERSVHELKSSLCPVFKRIDLNFPGIGNGKLKREYVLPLIEVLPDNVHIWEYGE